MPVRVVSSAAQQPITVNALVNNPLIIPERIIKVMSNQFAMDSILRYAGNVNGGAVSFRISSGLFSDDPSEVVAPGGEIPLVTRTIGDQASERVHKRALGIEIDREMRIRNATGEVERQLIILKNTLIRDFDGEFVAKLRSGVSQSVAATAAWDSGSATIRKDINATRLLITTSQAPGTTSGVNYMGYVPDTILFNPNTEAKLLNNTSFLQLVLGTTAASNTTSLPQSLLGLTPRISWGVPDGEAWVMQSNIVGGYADEIPLESTALYYEEPRQVWRSDTSRSTVAFIDNPQAAARITGV